jgi:NAD(P)-dependent dehydrogenase (short-subunit alcohol dehydrogenase family)
MAPPPVERKVALITGANRGIGFEVARQLGRRGMAVIVGARDPQRGVDAATTLRGDGIDAHQVRLDVIDEHTIQAAVQEVGRAFGRLDVLVNNCRGEAASAISNAGAGTARRRTRQRA